MSKLSQKTCKELARIWMAEIKIPTSQGPIKIVTLRTFVDDYTLYSHIP